MSSIRSSVSRIDPSEGIDRGESNDESTAFFESNERIAEEAVRNSANVSVSNLSVSKANSTVTSTATGVSFANVPLARHVGRVKVGVRVRPPFKEEMTPDFYLSAQIPISSVDEAASSTAEDGSQRLLPVLLGRPGSEKQRQYMFDYAFPPATPQAAVFQTVALPILNDVFMGSHGTIFAYGQTGTGKTFTMGILEMVSSGDGRGEKDGIIPRSLGYIYDRKGQMEREGEGGISVDVRLSFIQIYCETIQDLLAPANSTSDAEASSAQTSNTSRLSPSWFGDNSMQSGVRDDDADTTVNTTANTTINSTIAAAEIDHANLPIREDKKRGFYIQHLTTYAVNSYAEASSLVNLGLSNRIMAPTLMNTTSSRSHTVLTLTITQTSQFSSKKRSKLLLVDLAGSERIKRTTSTDVRLKEAQSINSSLSALGNVIAALSRRGGGLGVASSSRRQRRQHVPFRDSKLTKILQDSLSGESSTALIATLGPSPVNLGETASTLLFASRCMQVSSKPVVREVDVDWEGKWRELEEEVRRGREREVRERVRERERYEMIIHKLAKELREGEQSTTNGLANGSGQKVPSLLKSAPTLAADVMSSLSDISSEEWNGWEKDNLPAILSLCGVLYSLLCSLMSSSERSLLLAAKDVEEKEGEMEEKYGEIRKMEEEREREEMAMRERDGGGDALLNELGPHLGRVGLKEIRKRIGERLKLDKVDVRGDYGDNLGQEEIHHPKLSEFKSPAEFLSYCGDLSTRIQSAVSQNHNRLLATTEAYYINADSLAEMTRERKGREEEVVNWSFVLKYLLKTNSRLREEIKGRESLRGVLMNDSGGAKVEDEIIQSTSQPKVGTEVKSTSSITGMTPSSARKIVPNKEVADALIRKVSTLTEAEINSLPEEVKNNVRRLRAELGMRGTGGTGGEDEEEEEEEEEEDSDDDEFSQV